MENRWADGFVTNQLEQPRGGGLEGPAENMHPGLDLLLHTSLPGLAPTGLTASYCGCEEFGGLAITSQGRQEGTLPNYDLGNPLESTFTMDLL